MTTRITESCNTLMDNIFTNDLTYHISCGILYSDVSNYLPILLVFWPIKRTNQNLNLRGNYLINVFSQINIETCFIILLVNNLGKILYLLMIQNHHIHFLLNQLIQFMINAFNYIKLSERIFLLISRGLLPLF